MLIKIEDQASLNWGLVLSREPTVLKGRNHVPHQTDLFLGGYVFVIVVITNFRPN